MMCIFSCILQLLVLTCTLTGLFGSFRPDGEREKMTSRTQSLRGASSISRNSTPSAMSLSQARGPATTVTNYPYTEVFRPIFKELVSHRTKSVNHDVRSSLSVVVGIMSEHPWVDMRNIHRDSWMNSSCVSRDVSQGGVVPLFVLSGPADEVLEREMEDHADILLLPKPETPRNKTFAWFREAVEHMPGATHYAKMDSDTFLDPCALFSDLESLHFTQSQSLYYGHVAFKHDEFVCGVPETAARMPSLCGQASFAIEDSKAAVGNWEGRTFPRAGEGDNLGHTAMHGAFYLVSGNIAQWVAAGGDNAVHLPMTMERTHGNGEDVIFADWVARFFQVFSQLQPRIKNRASEQEVIFRHVSELLTDGQKTAVASRFPTANVSV